MNPNHLTENFFRQEYGRMVAVLVRRLGRASLDLAEDAVQNALLKGLQLWLHSPPPENPSAWIYRVAMNDALDELRKGARQKRAAARWIGELERQEREDIHEAPAEFEIQDALLDMLFFVCHPNLPLQSQLVLALKTLCGFAVPEIAPRLFLSEAHVYKRLQRARAALRSAQPSADQPTPLTLAEYGARLPAVLRVLYSLFNEGYLSFRVTETIRGDLCREAIRLVSLITAYEGVGTPEAAALRALMHLHAARLASRFDGSGGLLLLEEQDRLLWDQSEIQVGLWWLARSAQGFQLSRYHLEAGIAAEHCLAPSVGETAWAKIADYYQILETIEPSPLYRLNRAIALSRWQGPQAGLALLAERGEPPWLTNSHLWLAAQTELHFQAGQPDEARRFCQQALRQAPTPAVRALLLRRFSSLVA